MAVSERNRRRFRAILISREFKRLFGAVPERLAARLARPFVGWFLRAMFLAPDGKPHRAGEIVLAEIRRLGGMDRMSSFDPDPVVMAFREGKRSVVRQLIHLLNLDENEVHKMMELDDGI